MLEFYRVKVDSFERERTEWQEETEGIRLQLERMQGLELAVQASKMEITEI